MVYSRAGRTSGSAQSPDNWKTITSSADQFYSTRATRVSYFPQSINSYFYSTSVSYFLQSINSVQSWSPPHTLTYEEEIAALVSRFIDLVPSSSWNWKKKPPSFCFVIVKRPCKLSHINKRRRK